MLLVVIKGTKKSVQAFWEQEQEFWDGWLSAQATNLSFHPCVAH